MIYSKNRDNCQFFMTIIIKKRAMVSHPVHNTLFESYRHCFSKFFIGRVAVFALGEIEGEIHFFLLLTGDNSMVFEGVA